MKIFCYLISLCLCAISPAEKNASADSSMMFISHIYSLQKEDNGSNESFKAVWMGDGKAQDGTFLSMATYETTSGERVAVTQGKFSSTQAAKEQLRRSLKKAARIIEDSAKVDHAPRKNGRRVVALFSKTDAHQSYHAIVWTDQNYYY